MISWSPQNKQNAYFVGRKFFNICDLFQFIVYRINSQSIYTFGIRKIAPEENCPPVRVRVWIRVRISFRVGKKFSSGAIVLEPILVHFKKTLLRTRLISKSSKAFRLFLIQLLFGCLIKKHITTHLKI